MQPGVRIHKRVKKYLWLCNRLIITIPPSRDQPSALFLVERKKCFHLFSVDQQENNQNNKNNPCA